MIVMNVCLGGGLVLIVYRRVLRKNIYITKCGFGYRVEIFLQGYVQWTLSYIGENEKKSVPG